MSEQRKTLDEGAIAIHEIFLAYVRAGFTEPQALELIKALLIKPSDTGGTQDI